MIAANAQWELEPTLLELTILLELSGLPVHNHSVKSLCRAAAEKAARTLQSQVAVVLWRTAMSGQWQVGASIGQQAHELLPGLQYSSLHQLLAPTTGMTVTQDPYIMLKLFPRAQAKGAIIIPVEAGSLGYVALCAGRTTAEPFDAGQQRLYRILCGRLAMLLENLLLREEMRVAATTDALTALHNRRQFYADVEQMVQCYKSNRTPFMLMFLDLRRFKEINDQYGHHRGDALLRDFANVLRSATPTGGRAYRYGGDEFIILLEGQPGRESAQLAREIVTASEGLVRRGDSYALLTVDIGVSSCPHDGESADRLIQSADRRMYAAKFT